MENENLQALPVGTIIHGSAYKIEKVLGHGNFGITYRVTDTVLDSVYALKEFFPAEISDRNTSVSLMLDTPLRRKEEFEILKKKFISEAKAIHDCKHPGIVEIITVFPSTEPICYLMEYIDGVTLQEKYKGKPLAAADAIALVKKIAEPLKYVHGRKIAHFDLNPNNVMIKADGSVKLIDFGFSKRYDKDGHQLSSHMVAGGTPGYLAPEQAGGVIKEFTPSCDIYALGGIMYFFLTGHAPVPFQEFLIDDDLLFQELPAEFHDFFRRAMALKVKDRFASVDEFVAGLNFGKRDIQKVEEPKQKTQLDKVNAPVGKEVVSSLKDSPEKKENTSYKKIQNKERKWNFINAKGEYLSKQWFEDAEDFSDGWASVELNDKWNFINAHSQYLSKLWFDRAYGFSEGWASVKQGDNENFINTVGQYLSEQWFEGVWPFSEGWAAVELNGKWNFINAAGQFMGEQWFDFAMSFSEGWASVELNGKWNFINAAGQYQFSHWFDAASGFYKGWAVVCLNQKWNFINANGQYLSGQWFDNAEDFSKGWARVCLNDNWNFINANGQYLTKEWFEETSRFSEGWASVELNGKWNFINASGQYLSKQWFEDTWSFYEGWAHVKLNGKLMNINTKGQLKDL